MPRRRQVSDESLLQAALQCILRVGPDKLTLAEVAGEAGVSAATLLQRFGNKRALLLAVARSGSAAQQAAVETARQGRSPVEALLHLCERFARQMATPPEALAHHLAFLQIDLDDPEFHALAKQSQLQVRATFEELLRAAAAEGELDAVDAKPLSRALHGAYNGALLTWALDREGEPGRRVRADVEALLAPLRKDAGKKKPRK